MGPTGVPQKGLGGGAQAPAVCVPVLAAGGVDLHGFGVPAGANPFTFYLAAAAYGHMDPQAAAAVHAQQQQQHACQFHQAQQQAWGGQRGQLLPPLPPSLGGSPVRVGVKVKGHDQDMASSRREKRSKEVCPWVALEARQCRIHDLYEE